MTQGESKLEQKAAAPDVDVTKRPRKAGGIGKLLGVAVTLVACAIAVVFVVQAWRAYVTTPWTRDGAVRAYTISLAPEVSGRVVALPVRDNQFVHKGDLLMKIDPRDFKNTVDADQAMVDQAKATLANSKIQAERRNKLSDLAVTAEQRDNFNTGADTAQASLRRDEANLDEAKLNLERTEVRSPVNGWITNLLTQQGDYATTGMRALSVVDADSFWIDGYFEETVVKPIKVGDPARVWLMGFSEVIAGHVDSLARGINVSNATPNGAGLADVNPVFTWVRLAQRVPVRIHIDHVPANVLLAAGMTATVQIDPRPVPAGGPPSPTGGRTDAEAEAAR